LAPALVLVASKEYANLKELSVIDEYDSFSDYFELQKEKRETLKNELLETFNECSHANWDGYDAAPISTDSYQEAESFLDSLPVILPSPYIVPQPDGGLAFEWHGEENKIFVASFKGKKIIYLSWFFGNQNSGGSGRAELSEVIPNYIVRHIRFVCGEDDE